MTTITGTYVGTGGVFLIDGEAVNPNVAPDTVLRNTIVSLYLDHVVNAAAGDYHWQSCECNHQRHKFHENECGLCEL